MLVKLAALGALGYAGYKYVRKSQEDAAAPSPALAQNPPNRAAHVRRPPARPAA